MGVAFHFCPSHRLGPNRPFVMFFLSVTTFLLDISNASTTDQLRKKRRVQNGPAQVHLHGHVSPTPASSCELEDVQAVLQLELSFRADCVDSM